ncbi:hypothetical protein ACYOEI_04920 [Singulisphaera rosea]
MSEHVLSLFPVENQSELEGTYRLVEILGAFEGGSDIDQADKNLNLLTKQLSITERCPVAVVSAEGKKLLAVPGDTRLRTLEYSLAPHVVTLRPRDETHQLVFAAAAASERRIATQFLNFSLRSPLWNQECLWNPYPFTFFNKRPINYEDPGRDIDAFPGFSFRLTFLNDQLYLGIKLATKYVEREWINQRRGPSEIRDLKMRHLLYHMGHRWFTVQLVGMVGKSISEARFTPEGSTATDVFAYTVDKTKADPPEWIRDLDPNSPAIFYRYTNKSVQRYGAASLCKLMLRTTDPRVRPFHRWSIIPPDERFQYLSKIVRKYFSHARFADAAVQIGTAPLRAEGRVFPIPAIRFGGDKILSVVGRSQADGIYPNVLGRERMNRLLDSSNGLAVSRPFGNQYLLVPKGIPREIAEDFRSRIERTVTQMSRTPFSMKSVLYDDSSRTLRDQVESVVKILNANSIDQGHGILMLPARRHPQLYHFVKRKLLDRIQMKCVAEERLRSFYAPSSNNRASAFHLRNDREQNFASYLRYTGLGLLIVNRLWPWVLASKTNYDVHIGIDVLNGNAAFCFLYEGGRRCFVRVHPSKQKEKLSRRDLFSTLYEHLKVDLVDCPSPVNSILIHRDGKLFEREWQGIGDAITKLKDEKRLGPDTFVGAIEIQKHDSLGLRLVRRSGNMVVNPDVGSYFATDKVEAILCTTGEPFRMPGTVDPLKVRVARGPVDLDAAAADVFDLSNLCWMVPDRCIRLPITLKLCDDFLRSIAGGTDEDEEDVEDDETPDEAFASRLVGETSHRSS